MEGLRKVPCTPANAAEMLGMLAVVSLHIKEKGRVASTCRRQHHYLFVVVRYLQLIFYENALELELSGAMQGQPMLPPPLTLQGQRFNVNIMCEFCGVLTSNLSVAYISCIDCKRGGLCNDCLREMLKKNKKRSGPDWFRV